MKFVWASKRLTEDLVENNTFVNQKGLEKSSTTGNKHFAFDSM